jgi:putative tricarboxylic transport membrane protein
VSTLEHTTPSPDGPDGGAAGPDRAQYALAALLTVAGVYTVVDASTLEVGFADPVGPKVFPYVIGAGMVVLSVLLTIATARGSRPEPEAGEDVDLTQRPDWLTVGKLVAVLLFTVATVALLGWAVSGTLLFAGAARVLGSRTTIRDVIVGALLAVGSWYGFYVGLGIPLTPGVLDGIL